MQPGIYAGPLMERERPKGITILAIFGLIAGPLTILSVVVFLFFIAVFHSIPPELLFIPFLELAWGCLGVAAATGLLLFARWGWILSVALAAFTAVSSPFGTILGIIVLWYLFRPEVRAIFEPRAYLPMTIKFRSDVRERAG